MPPGLHMRQLALRGGEEGRRRACQEDDRSRTQRVGAQGGLGAVGEGDARNVLLNQTSPARTAAHDRLPPRWWQVTVHCRTSSGRRRRGSGASCRRVITEPSRFRGPSPAGTPGDSWGLLGVVPGVLLGVVPGVLSGMVPAGRAGGRRGVRAETFTLCPDHLTPLGDR